MGTTWSLNVGKSGRRSESRSSLSPEDGDELDTLISKTSLDSPSSPTFSEDNTLPQHTRRRPPLLRTTSSRKRYCGFEKRVGAILLLFVYSAICLAALAWTARFLLLRHDAYGRSVFARPLIPNALPVEPLASAFPPSPTSHAALQSTLDTRLHALSIPPSTLPCAWTPADEEKYAYLAGKGRYLFALNLWNNQVVFPTLSRTLLHLSYFLGLDNVHVSIFENGSSDNTTLAMAELAAGLTSAGIAHTILSDKRRTDWKKVDRIAQLAVYRNLVIAPLNGTREGEKAFGEIVFINDVFVCPRDALELLHQREVQSAHAACALDWRATQSWLEWIGFSSVKFYDNCVSRTITGDMLRSRFDILAETRDGVEELFDQPGSEFSRDRFRAGLPVPVYSCWNGMLALPAAPFRGDDGPAVEFRSALNHAKECAASECKTVARDFWAQGLNRWIIVPNVHVTYAKAVYSHPSLVELANRTAAPHKLVPELIDWSTIDPPESVVCYSWARGFHMDLPYRRTREAPWR